VDILASFKLPSQQRAKGQALSTTLLQGIQVLAVDDITVVSNEEQKQGAIGDNTSGKKLMVTFMVDPKQAEALQLAREYGSVSVAMRNPLDQYVFSSEATLLSEGQLAKFSSLMTPAALAAEQRKTPASRMRNIDGRITDTEGGDGETEAGLEGEEDYYAEDVDQTSTWDITVIRGKDVKVQEMEMPGQEEEAAEGNEGQ
jgi:Flp pilus assembly protein CpaB